MRFTSGLLAVALAYVDLTSAQNSTGNITAIIANLEHYWSYGRSAPSYPTPQGVGGGEWTDAYNRAKALVAQMTLDERNNITYGHPSTTGCSGVSGSVPRLGFPGLCLQDAGNGVRVVDTVNAYSAGIHAGAAWNRDLAYQRAFHLGAEFRRKGVSVALGPVAGPLGKVAEGGRNWEGFSNDPYLAGVLTADTIQGLQKNVISCVKHFIGNEQETNRNPPSLVPGYNQSLSENINEKTLHELYMWPFQDAIKAGAGSVMCSYNKLNNSYACQNSHAQNGLLKGELGFQGFVVSDWGAQRTGIASANAGLDMAMPSSPYWQDGNLTLAVNNGSMAESRLDDMAVRIVASWYRLNELGSDAFENPGFGIPSDFTGPHELIDARDPSSKGTLLQSAVEGHVLVKNTGVLPLSKPKYLSLFGYDALPAAFNTFPAGYFSKWAFGLSNAQTYPDGRPFTDDELLSLFLSSSPAGDRGPGIAMNGTLFTGGGSGAAIPSYIDAPYDAFLRQAREDDTFLSWDFVNQNPLVNQGSQHCIVFINSLASEGWDRPDIADPYSDVLVNNVASQCNSTIVVIHNAGVRLVDRWVDNPNVTAVIFAHLPGQDSGQALVDVMYGKQSPSGRLPYTVAHNESDYGILLAPVVPVGTDYYTQDNHTEGIYIDYKHFIAQNITPRYEFGYGLTYSTFNYSSLSVQKQNNASFSPLPRNETIVEGGLPSLWDVLAKVTCTVTNTGKVTAAEVPQLYLHIPNGPAKVLRGFGKKTLAANQSATFEFDLTRRDLSTWTAQGWLLQRGSYPVYVGKSVLDIQLTGSLTI